MFCGKTDESLFRIRLIERLDGWRRLSVDMSDDLREAVDGNQPFQLAIPGLFCIYSRSFRCM